MLKNISFTHQSSSFFDPDAPIIECDPLVGPEEDKEQEYVTSENIKQLTEEALKEGGIK